MALGVLLVLITGCGSQPRASIKVPDETSQQAAVTDGATCDAFVSAYENYDFQSYFTANGNQAQSNSDTLSKAVLKLRFTDPQLESIAQSIQSAVRSRSGSAFTSAVKDFYSGCLTFEQNHAQAINAADDRKTGYEPSLCSAADPALTAKLVAALKPTDSISTKPVTSTKVLDPSAYKLGPDFASAGLTQVIVMKVNRNVANPTPGYVAERWYHLAVNADGFKVWDLDADIMDASGGFSPAQSDFTFAIPTDQADFSSPFERITATNILFNAKKCEGYRTNGPPL